MQFILLINIYFTINYVIGFKQYINQPKFINLTIKKNFNQKLNNPKQCQGHELKKLERNNEMNNFTIFVVDLIYLNERFYL